MPDDPFLRPDGPRVASGSPPDPVSIRSPAELDRVLSGGRRCRTGDLTVVKVEGVIGVVRYGLVAGKRIGNAVKRNRIKRRLRAAVRENVLTPGFDYVLIAGPGVAFAPFATLVEWLQVGAAGDTTPDRADDGGPGVNA